MPAPYWTVWLLIICAWITNYLVRMALAALLPGIIGELRLSYTEAGFLSTAFFYAYLAMQVPAGVLGDRIGRKRMLAGGVVLGAGASALTAMAGSFGALFGARLLTGLAQGCLFSNDRVIIASTTPRDRIALGQGISFSGAGIGTTLGLLLAGLLGETMPWRGVFLVFAVPPLVAAALIWRIVPEPPRHASVPDPSWSLGRVLKTRDFWLLGVTGIMPVYVQFVLATWAPLFFAEVGVTDLGRSASLASLQGLPAPAGLFCSGLLADRLRRRGLPAKLIIAATLVCLALSVTGMGLVVRARGSAWLLAALMVAASFFMWSAWGPAYAILGDLFPPALLGRAFGLYNSTCFVGAVVGPLIAGVLKDLTGSFASALFAAAVLAVCGSVTALALTPAFRVASAPAGCRSRTPIA